MMNTWKVWKPNRLLSEVKRQFLEVYTTKQLRWTIEHNRCFVNSHVERFCSRKVQKGDTISICVEQPPIITVEKERILYEDSDLLVYNKPISIASEDLSKLLNFNLVHRLDRDTSGVILFAKNQQTQDVLEEHFKNRQIHKEYLTIVEGHPQNEGVISGNMSVIHRREGAVMWGMSEKGKWSKTVWAKLEQYASHALLKCSPITGRTHQIRVHLKYIGHPVVGDFVYGSSHPQKQAFRPLLHSSVLKLTHPSTQEMQTFFAPLPQDFMLS